MDEYLCLARYTQTLIKPNSGERVTKNLTISPVKKCQRPERSYSYSVAAQKISVDWPVGRRVRLSVCFGCWYETIFEACIDSSRILESGLSTFHGGKADGKFIWTTWTARKILSWAKKLFKSENDPFAGFRAIRPTLSKKFENVLVILLQWCLRVTSVYREHVDWMQSSWSFVNSSETTCILACCQMLIELMQRTANWL